MRLLLILLAFYPSTISLSTTEATPGALVVATISAPAGSAVRLEAPAFVRVGPIVYLGGETWRAELTVRGDNAYGRVELLVDGVQKDSAPIRVGAPQVARVWLPLYVSGS